MIQLTLKKLSTLVFFVLVLGFSAFAQTVYVDVTNGDDGFGAGTTGQPYRSISKAITVLGAADGGTISIAAGVYSTATTGAAGEDALAITGSKNYTLVATPVGINTTVSIPGGFTMNGTGIVSLGETGVQFNLGTSTTALRVLQGTLNIATANVVLGSGGRLTIDGTAVINQAPTKTTNMDVYFTGVGSLSTGSYFPASLGSGAININKASGTLTITQAISTTGTITVAGGGAVTFTNDVASGDIDVTAGNVEFQGNLTLGSATNGSAKDLTNSGTGEVIIGAAGKTLTAYATSSAANQGNDIQVGEIINSSTGKITVNANVVYNVKNLGVSTDAADGDALVLGLPVLSNTSTGTLTVNGTVTFNNTNVKGTLAGYNDITHALTISNSGAGTLALKADVTTPASAAGFTNTTAVNVKIVNNGTMTVRNAALRGVAGTLGLTNTATLTLGQSGDTFTTDYDAQNNGASAEFNVTGNATFGGAFTNTAGKVYVNNSNSTIKGLLTNAASIILGSNVLTLSGAPVGANILDNTGSIYSANNGEVGTGLIKFTGANNTSQAGTEQIFIANSGNLPALEFAGSATLYQITNGANIFGTLTVSGAGTLTIGGATAAKANVNLNNGAITLGANLTVSGTFNMPAGTFTFGASTLDLKGDFNRTGGTIGAAQAGTGVLSFTGNHNQSFIPGVQMTVYDVLVNNTGFSVLNDNVISQAASLLVLHDYTITNGKVALGGSNIRMLQGGGVSARFTNNGDGYTTSGEGGLIFEGTGANGAGGANGAVITGGKPFANIYVRLSVATNDVYCLGAVKISGKLALQSGGITWNQADDVDLFSSSTLTLDQSLTGAAFPTVLINTDNDFTNAVMLDGADGGAVALAITTKYNLTYQGTTSRATAGELVATKLQNLSIETSNTNTITLPAADVTMGGSLNVNSGQTLALANGAQKLTADGSAAHTISGTVSVGVFEVSGATATVTGGTATADASSINNLTISAPAASFTSTGVKNIGALIVNSNSATANITMNGVTATVGAVTNTTGTLNLSMNSAASAHTGILTVSAGSVTYTRNSNAAGTRTINGAVTLTAGTLTLGSKVDVAGGFTQAAGNLVLGDNDLTLTNDYTRTGTGTITSAAGYVIAAPAGAQTYTFNAGSQIPSFKVDGGGNSVTFAGGGLEVTNAFVHKTGTIALATFPLTVSAPSYTYDGGTYTATGATGVVVLKGAATTVTASNSPVFPYLEVNTTGNVTLATSDFGGPSGAAVAKDFTVSQAFTDTKGTIALGINNLKLTNVGGTDASFTSTANAGTISGDGAVTFEGANGNHAMTLGGNLQISNVKVSFATTKTDNKVLTVPGTFTLGANFTFADAARLVLGNGATIVRSAGVFDQVPTFGTTVNVSYTGAVTTNKELPASATTINNLTVDAAVTLNANATVNGTYHMKSGLLTQGAKVLTIATDATVKRTAGTIDNPFAYSTFKLVYTNTIATNTDKEFVDNASAITALEVKGSNVLTLVNDRTVGSLTVSTANATDGFALGADNAAKTLTVSGATTITKGIVSTKDAAAANTTTGTLVLLGNLTVSGGTLGNLGADNAAGLDGGLSLTIGGADDQNITLNGNQTFSNLTLNQSVNGKKITLAGGNLTIADMLTFVNGVLVTGTNTLYIPAPLLGGGQGFDRSGVTGAKVSHVVGNVAKTLVNGGTLATATEPRSEFPVGSLTLYRPAAITFNAPQGIPTVPPTTLIVSHSPAAPTGTVGLPIVNGVAEGVNVSRYPDFFWTVSSYPSSVSASIAFDLELGARGFSDFDDINNVRIIRRNGTGSDVTNQWLLQGTSVYDNEVNGGVPTIINKSATAGLRAGGAMFTLGIKSNLRVLAPIANKDVQIGSGAAKVVLSSPAVFGGNIGQLVYTAQSSNATVATVTVSNDTLSVNPVAQGSATVTVKATDVNNDFITTTFNVTVTPVTQFAVNGKVTYDNTAATAMAGVVVTLTPGNLTATTDATGAYSIANVPNGSYTVKATSTSKWGGANATDALRIANYYNGTQTLTTLQTAAADVNASATVNNTDALKVLRRFNNLDTTFAAGDWTFTSPSVTVSGAIVNNADIKALNVGDVNGSNTPTGNLSKAAMTSEGTIDVNPGATLSVPVKVDAQNLGAVSLQFKYSEEMATLAGVSSKLEGLQYSAKNGVVTVAWADLSGKAAFNADGKDAFITLNFKPAETMKAGKTFGVELVYGELATADAKVINNALLKTSEVKVAVPSEFALRQNYPNPFNPSTTIQYDLPVDSKVSLVVFNMLGQEVYTLVNGVQAAGTQKVQFNAQNLTSGIYFYTLNVSNGDQKFTQTYKMILMK